jgi:Tfp pilus assembly protein PilX
VRVNMKSDNYIKLLVALLVVCAIAYCLTQVRIATALERALSLADSEAQRRAAAEERIAEQMRRSEVARQEEAKERLDVIKRLEGKNSSTAGFTAMPFATA